MYDITVVFFLWGEDWCDGNGFEYLEKLVRGIKKYSHQKIKFVCFCDDYNFNNFPVLDDVGFRKFDCPSWAGCLPKLKAYDISNNFPTEQVFVFDLDTVVTGSLDSILGYRGEFCTRVWFGGLPAINLSGGDLVSFKRDMWEWIWEKFVADTNKFLKLTRGGRERYVYRKLIKTQDFWQMLFPNQYCSYKRHIERRNKIPSDTRLVSCHGDPRPHMLPKTSIIREYWK